MKRDNPDYSIVDITLNSEKSPGDQRRLAVILTTMKDYQLTLEWKAHNNNNNNNDKYQIGKRQAIIA